MQFRWVVIITLWTFLSGPVFAPIVDSAPRPRLPATIHLDPALLQPGNPAGAE